MNFNELIFLVWAISLFSVALYLIMHKTHKDDLKDKELMSILKYNIGIKLVMYIAPLTFAIIGAIASYLDYKQKNAQLPLSLAMLTIFTILEVISFKYFHSFSIILRDDSICRRVSLFKDKVINWKDITEVAYKDSIKSIKIKDTNGKSISVGTESMNGLNSLYKAFVNNLDSDNPVHAEIIKKYSEYI